MSNISDVASEIFFFFQYFFVFINFALLSQLVVLLLLLCALHIHVTVFWLTFSSPEAVQIQINYLGSNFSCISNDIFYIPIKRLGQKFCFSFIITLLSFLVCLSVTMTVEKSFSIFTLSFFRVLSGLLCTLYFLQGNQDTL